MGLKLESVTIGQLFNFRFEDFDRNKHENSKKKIGMQGTEPKPTPALGAHATKWSE